MLTYHVTAATGDASEQSAEVLGESYGKIYLSREAAESACVQLAEDATDNGLTGVRYSVVEARQGGDLLSFARAVLGLRHSGHVDILDDDAYDPTTEAGRKASGDYSYLCPLRTWNDVETLLRRRGRDGAALQAAAARMLAQEGVVL